MVWVLETNQLNQFRKCSFLHKLEAITHCMFVLCALILQTRDNVQYLVAEGTKEILSLHFTRGSLSALVNKFLGSSLTPLASGGPILALGPRWTLFSTVHKSLLCRHGNPVEGNSFSVGIHMPDTVRANQYCLLQKRVSYMSLDKSCNLPCSSPQNPLVLLFRNCINTAEPMLNAM